MDAFFIRSSDGFYWFIWAQVRNKKGSEYLRGVITSKMDTHLKQKKKKSVSLLKPDAFGSNILLVLK